MQKNITPEFVPCVKIYKKIPERVQHAEKYAPERVPNIEKYNTKIPHANNTRHQYNTSF